MSKNLYLRNGIWWARFKVAGIEYRRSLRTRSERAAERRLKAAREEIEDEAVFGIEGPVSWPEAVVSWNAGIGGAVGPKTLHRYATSLRQLRAFLDHLSVQAITADVLKDMIKSRRRAGVKNATIRRDLTALSSVLNHACDEGWIADNPAASLNRRRLVPERAVKIVLPQASAMQEMFAKLPSRIVDMCEFTREQGLRLDEVANLRHADIDRKGRLVTVRKGKGDKVRVVELTATGEAIIDRQPQFIGKPWCFWKDGVDPVTGAATAVPITGVSSRVGGYMRRAARKAAQEAREFEPFSHHDFRHLFAVEYLRSGRGGIYELQREMGHDSISTTERYLAFLTPEQAKAAMHGVAQKAAQEQRFGAVE